MTPPPINRQMRHLERGMLVPASAILPGMLNKVSR